MSQDKIQGYFDLIYRNLRWLEGDDDSTLQVASRVAIEVGRLPPPLPRGNEKLLGFSAMVGNYRVRLDPLLPTGEGPHWYCRCGLDSEQKAGQCDHVRGLAQDLLKRYPSDDALRNYRESRWNLFAPYERVQSK